MSLLSRNTIAIVGARNASLGGRQLASSFANQLQKQGWTVVSGFARGIDSAAHEGSLEGGSIAVFGCGIGVIYPPEHEKFFPRFIETGLIISEFPFSAPPAASNFPRRNRLIAHLCLGVLVIEAAFNSGSLITAQLANESGRDVFAVPGSPLDPRCKGSNKLLREGAQFVETVWDILNFYPQQALVDLKRASSPSQDEISSYTQEFYDEDGIKQKIIEALSYTSIDLNLLVDSVGLCPQKIGTLLSDLELEGYIERRPGNQVALSVRNPL